MRTAVTADRPQANATDPWRADTHPTAQTARAASTSEVRSAHRRRGNFRRIATDARNDIA